VTNQMRCPVERETKFAIPSDRSAHACMCLIWDGLRRRDACGYL
jgi:hypothetical protein